MPDVEQHKARRAGTGVRAHDQERACPGFTLFAPQAGHRVYLIDLDGTLVHSWQMPYEPGEYGYLTERGTLFFNGKIPNDSYLGRKPFQGGAALEMDWHGRVLWEVRNADHHHDGIRLRNGNVLLLCATVLPPDLVPRVRGGRPGTEPDGRMHADYLTEVTTDGRPVWEWRSWEYLDPNEDVIPAPQTERDEWTHGNSVSELPDGNLLLSFRNLSSVMIADRQTGAITWKLGSPPLAHQHAPTPLASGNILIFDNGTHRLDHFLPYSRVIEVDPTTNRIVWEYKDNPISNFFSPLISNAQRLPNGNTLICEGVFGRLFEVTREGAVVWEYVNPYFGPRAGAEVNSVFRAYRYSADEIARARGTG